jgi:hypothetical protein
MNAADSSIFPPEVALILALETTARKSGAVKGADILLAGRHLHGLYLGDIPNKN